MLDEVQRACLARVGMCTWGESNCTRLREADDAELLIKPSGINSARTHEAGPMATAHLGWLLVPPLHVLEYRYSTQYFTGTGTRGTWYQYLVPPKYLRGTSTRYTLVAGTLV